MATVLQLEARLLELPLANRYSRLVDRGETFVADKLFPRKKV